MPLPCMEAEEKVLVTRNLLCLNSYVCYSMPREVSKPDKESRGVYHARYRVPDYPYSFFYRVHYEASMAVARAFRASRRREGLPIAIEEVSERAQNERAYVGGQLT